MDSLRYDIASQDWYFLVLLLLIALFSVFVYYAVIPIDLGLGALIILFIMLFFSLEEVMPNARKARKRRFHSRRAHQR